ncbi:hypothetical protein CBS63078_10046 [Aspergillus niger]|nr:hypothetical protein CBS133816_7568 [Aspergillus niger]KAI2860687.1 hypothetical protein CBS12448_5134 [Aspergillus niger]KAI2890292.1 hypothetical protein CBS63078_10046 [Aspergillus niger]KAI2898097.1 hypothetical protein CBS13152_2876 [Aspergillus niger]KAI2920281.1 hypothetical protein CBS147371_3379 [Aspergillus niger]
MTKASPISGPGSTDASALHLLGGVWYNCPMIHSRNILHSQNPFRIGARRRSHFSGKWSGSQLQSTKLPMTSSVREFLRAA